MSTALWAHQRAAVDFALARSGALWHMGMGVGKTRAALEVALSHRRALVVAPKSVVDVWPFQVRAHGMEDQIRALALSDGSTRSRAAEMIELRDATDPRVKIAVVNYEACLSPEMQHALHAYAPDLAILDESHRVKAPFGKTSKFLRAFTSRVQRRVLLTGTPMPHSPLDVWSQLYCVDPAVLGWSFVQFRARYAVMRSINGHPIVSGFKNRAELATKMSGVTFQVGRDVLTLPPVVDTTIPVRLGQRARRAYRDLEVEMRADLARGAITAANGLVRLLRFQQITGGVVPVDEGDGDQRPTVIDEAKLDALIEILEDLEPDEPVVVFARFSGDLALIHEAARRAGSTSMELSGSRKELADWQAGGARVLATQIQAGGVGVDLTRAAHCVFWSLGYSLGEYEQALARVHRPGQTRTTHYYHLVAEDTVDEDVRSALQRRADVVAAVLDRLGGGRRWS